MEQCIAGLNVVIGNMFVMYFKAHSYHWNVEGKNFSEMHNFFGSMYEEIHGAIDVAAEELRALEQYAPISLNDMNHFSTIPEDTIVPINCDSMLKNLLDSNEEVVHSLNIVFAEATKNNKQGLADFIAGRLDAHAKHNWMLKSYLKD